MKHVLLLIALITFSAAEANLSTVDKSSYLSKFQIREHLQTTTYWGCVLGEFNLNDRNTSGYIVARCSNAQTAYRHPEFPSNPPAGMRDRYELSVSVLLGDGWFTKIYCVPVEFKQSPLEVIVDCLPDQ